MSSKNPVLPANGSSPVATAQACHSQKIGESASIPSNGGQKTAQLLVSVRDSAEATLAQAAGVDWIDLKEPRSGALGRAELQVAQAVAEQLVNHNQRSAALGELHHLKNGVAADFAKLFPFLKVGLSQLQPSRLEKFNNAWRDQFLSLASDLHQLGSHLIPVIYADYQTCDAPSPDDVLCVAQQAGAQFVLIDTFTKNGLSLTDWLGIHDLQAKILAARNFDCGVVLAGSLKTEHVHSLAALAPKALGVRGAVCTGHRGGTVCPKKLSHWCALMHCRPLATDANRELQH